MTVLDDIYNNKAKYERQIRQLKLFLLKPSERAKQLKAGKDKADGRHIGQYYCKNSDNMQHWDKLIQYFDSNFEGNELSYIRRLRLIAAMKEFMFLSDKAFVDIEKADDRDAINKMVAAGNKIHSAPGMGYFKKDLKTIWKVLFPARDVKGRIDETRTPYVVRHLTTKIERSKIEKAQDRIEPEIFTEILSKWDKDPRMQALISLIYYTFTRPQELLQRKIGDLKLSSKNCSYLTVGSHGKEGPKEVLIAEPNPYLMRWLNVHPNRKDTNAWLFCNRTAAHEQLNIPNANKLIRLHLARLGIKKRLTLYSFKRNGITDARLKGDSERDIQTMAGWSSTRQLKTYDIASDRQAMHAIAIRKGLIKPGESEKELAPTTKQCPYCQAYNPIDNKTCNGCSRLLWVEDIEKEEKAKATETKVLKDQMAEVIRKLSFLENFNKKKKARK